ncbi:rRNA maturation RNase YbeY [Fibrobacter sp. UWEL]|uniref:rRNA maturation RNase YbeY n=1 Tax=Fibrobacter sp. UWEL TaxID=1896209 RepID=UPI00090F3516|nr:rRNA maturation RNase YbeY [Fibrobacter sp. UWEL]SHK56954.1 probable rRNA maturation factor [Fibrobacter sp. UWEL]
MDPASKKTTKTQKAAKPVKKAVKKAAPEYNIDFLLEGDIDVFPYKDKFETMARKLLAEEGKEKDVNIVLCSDEFVREMNKNYRGLDKVTDVLSFEWHAEFPGEPEMLGEIYIAKEQVKRQAPEYGNTFYAEMKRVIVHGLLHLSGYDHIKAADRKVMRARECEFLGLDPYKEKD